MLLRRRGDMLIPADVASFLAIAYTSSLTTTVAGNFKAVINIVVSVLVFRNQVSNSVFVPDAHEGHVYVRFRC